MGCFLACFGLSNKRKRRKTLYKVLAPHQKNGSYETLAIVPYSDLRVKDEFKEKTSVKRKKKVRFNLNVQIFEPDPTAYQILDNGEDENRNTTAESEGGVSPSTILGKENQYPANHRYYNCRDEEDEIAYEESDIDDYDTDDEFDNEDDWDDGEILENDDGIEVFDRIKRQKELSEKFYYCSMSEGRIKHQMPLALNDTELKSNLCGRERGINMHSVLSPVENLTQWKAIKAKVISSKKRKKENVPSEPKTSMPLVSETSLNFSPCSLESNVLQSMPLLPEIAVDASLSSWLISPNYIVSKTTIH